MRHLRLTESQLTAMKGKRVDLMHVKTGRPMGKYGNKRTVVDGIEFDSRKEAKRWQELRLLESGGRISGLRRQVAYPLVVNNVFVCTYVSDFAHTEHDGTIVVSDVKGYKKGAAYAMFRLKAKLMLAIYGVEVKEI